MLYIYISLYKCTLENKLKINDTYGVWKSLEQITGYKIKSQVISDDITLPDEVNVFYSRFENTMEGQAGQPMLPSWPCTMSPSFKIEEYEVRICCRGRTAERQQALTPYHLQH